MRRPVQEDLHQINDKIRAREVRLVGENVEPGVYPLAKALEIAREQELDLVVISDKAEPYISRILDYKKFLYEQKKKTKELKAKQVKVVVKKDKVGFVIFLFLVSRAVGAFTGYSIYNQGIIIGLMVLRPM